LDLISRVGEIIKEKRLLVYDLSQKGYDVGKDALAGWREFKKSKKASADPMRSTRCMMIRIWSPLKKWKPL